jgi:hypothetical protein
MVIQTYYDASGRDRGEAARLRLEAWENGDLGAIIT